MSRPAEVDIFVAMTREVARYAEKAGVVVCREHRVRPQDLQDADRLMAHPPSKHMETPR
jgi:hypothetical protein